MSGAPSSRVPARRSYGLAVLFMACLSGWLLGTNPDDHTSDVVMDIVESLVLLGAGLLCSVRAWRCRGRLRRAWLLVGLGVLAWAAGQLVWTWYEVVRGIETPFPSLADVGYLTFPVLASAGVIEYARAFATMAWSSRTVLDGAIVAISLFTLSWMSALGAVYREGGDSRWAFSIAVAYPLTDVVIATVVLFTISRAASARRVLWMITAGLLLMACADSGFAYFATTGEYETGVIDLAWVAAFMLIGAAAAEGRHEVLRAKSQEKVSVGWLLLPYIPLAAVAGLLQYQAYVGELDQVQVLVAYLLGGCVLLRQFVTLLDNVMLLRSVRAREAELTHQAFHDPLTGLANRALFDDRMLRAAAAARRHPIWLSALLIDLDDFKEVNDTLGHAAGDALLVEVANRITQCVRLGDTVARLGGDEFAVVIEDGRDRCVSVTERILTALGEPIQLNGHRISVAASIGVAHLESGGEPAPVVEQLLRAADVAMYAAKAAGKHCAREFGAGLLAETGVASRPGSGPDPHDRTVTRLRVVNPAPSMPEEQSIPEEQSMPRERQRGA